MDANRFDCLIRELFHRSSRRGVLAVLTAGLLATMPLATDRWDAAARRKRRRKRKKKTCKGGKKKCGKQCVDLATDGNHCGICGNACASGTCIHGACTCNGAVDCPAGCLCASREEDLPDGCQSGVDATDTCNEDADCPFRSFCRGVGNTCTLPCPA